METKPKNRAWVKDAAIVFLVVLLILTFFSNTIMNHSLPEVATQMVTDGTITAKVRGTGKVTALGDHKVKATSNQTIGKVAVKAGQEVNAGDILFVLGAGDSTELEEAMNTLEDLQTQYAQAALSVPLADAHRDEYNAMIKAQETYETAVKAYNQAVAESEQPGTSETITNLLAQQSKLQNTISIATSKLNEQQLVLSYIEGELSAATAEYQRLYAAYQTGITPTPTPSASVDGGDAQQGADTGAQTAAVTQAEVEAARVKMENLKTQLAEKQQQTVDTLYDSDGTTVIQTAEQRLQYITDLQYKIDTLNLKLKAIEEELSASGADAANITAKKQAMDDAQYDYESKASAYYNAVASSERSIASANVGLSAIGNQIKRQQEKIKKLSGEGDGSTITANVSGTVTEINCTAGDTVLKDDILCSIEVPDMGYTVSFSVTNEQAQRLKVGDTASISNYYWGNSIEATLASIQTDKKNPMTNKTLTFNLEGDVTSGSELTISVGEKSARYDVIIPNSAIRTDSNGSFVLAVTAKSSPLGNRYIAKRVSIETLASDDTNSAVTADLSYGDYVITTSSAPVSSGDMVRMADSET